MAPSVFVPILSCLGISRKTKNPTVLHTASKEHKYTDSESDDVEIDAAAIKFVNILIESERTSLSDHALRADLQHVVTTCNYRQWLAKVILNKLAAALRNGAILGKAAKEAVEKATEAAIGFAKDHPVFCTIIAIGVLAIMAPYVLEVLGFAELGPVEGSWAALWQSRYVGYVPAGSLFSYFQRLGMVWCKGTTFVVGEKALL